MLKVYIVSGVSNNHIVWNKRTAQGIFPKLITAQGCQSTDQYRANKRTELRKFVMEEWLAVGG